MGKTYAIPDLHGRYDLMRMALDKIEAGNPAGGKVVFLGDYIDRGPDSRKIIETLMAGPPEHWEWVCLKGNHEDMMVGTLGGPDEYWWRANGGNETMASYGDVPPPQEHLDWCQSLPMIHDDGKRVFVHAAIDSTKPVHEQNEAVLLWKRYNPPNADEPFPSRHIVHGHTPERSGPMLYPSRTNLDAGAVFTGNLAIAVFDDDKYGGPSQIWKVTA